MATYGVGFDESFKAAVDLSAKQYYWVRAGSVVNEVALATGGSVPQPIGILQNNPKAGEEAVVRIFGISKLAASATASTGAASAIANGDIITCGSGGLGVKASASVFNAMALEAVGSGTGATIKVFINPPFNHIG